MVRHKQTFSSADDQPTTSANTSSSNDGFKAPDKSGSEINVRKNYKRKSTEIINLDIDDSFDNITIRETDYSDEKLDRLERIKQRNAKVRAIETSQQREKRLEHDKFRAVLSRANENNDERNMRIAKQTLINRQRGSQATKFNLLDHANVQIHLLSPMDVLCCHCSGVFFSEELIPNKGNSFKICCHHGSVILPDFPEKNFPTALIDLFTLKDIRFNKFFECIRHINSSVSTASFNPFRFKYPNNRGPYCFRISGQIYHKINLALLPDTNDPPAFGQIFILDTNEAVNALTNANPNVDPTLLKCIYELMKEINPYSKAYVMMKEEVDLEMDKAIKENREPIEVKLAFTNEKTLDRRLGYNIPKANEVAAVFIPGADGDIPNAKFVIRERGKELKILNSTDKNVTPMTYPLFFPRGSFGWHPDLKQINTNKTVSRLQYVSYTLAIRPKQFNPILYGRKLFQQYCVDEWVKIEGDRMRWIRLNQKKICAEAYKNVDNFLNKRANETGLPIGRKIILPSTVTNSPRYVEKHFQDAMAMVRRFGNPDLFVTMTTNPLWSEITDNLFHGQISQDRPDLVDRVAKLKFKIFMNYITKTKIFGLEVCWMYPVENQGRGLPHIHLLLTLSNNDKIRDAVDVERINISARIPDKNKDPILYNLVKKFMIHGPCGDINPNSPCMEEVIDKNGKKIKKCSKGYPKNFQEETVVLENGLALYSRPNDGTTIDVFIKGQKISLDNRWVVPHVPYLLKRFNCHINVEKVNSISSVKYLHKYVHKPPDKAKLQIISNDHDEINDFIDARYVCPQLAIWRIFEFSMYERSHSIFCLPVHLEGEHICYFDENMDEDEIRYKIENSSELLAYFNLNKINLNARSLLYHEVPELFVYNKGKWTERKAHFNSMGRMVKVSPAESERYYLRLLLLHVKGATSFNDMKTFNGIVYTTYAETCLARNLIRDDEEWKKALEEANSFEMPWKLREFFSLILVHCNPSKPHELWELFKDALSEDYAKNFIKEIAYNKAYKDIAKKILEAGKSLIDFPTMDQINLDDEVEETYNCAEQLDLGQRKYKILNDEQKHVVDSVYDRVMNPIKESYFAFMSGVGGSGKTMVNKTLVHLLRAKKKIVCCTAFTGIAATLLPKGRTLHNRFGLNLNMINSKIGPLTKAWSELKAIDLFINDEAPMVNKRALYTIDEKLKEIMNSTIDFGGKPFLWSGDFRQSTTIQKFASKSELIDATIKGSKYWKKRIKFKLKKNMRTLDTERVFAEYLLDIGDGKTIDKNEEIVLPAHCVTYNDLSDIIFGEVIKSKNWNSMGSRAIGASLHIDVREINNKVLSMLENEEVLYTSVDHAENEGQREDQFLDEYLLHLIRMVSRHTN